ncbi:FAD binding domain-containing protein [Blastomyces gilchristii SLH14081]|uniref:FAD binding domain-containing protein n=1 Tax=Blastomyces gilchristii (strain SLH14081) TaxID=559298 RepID=A0A179UZN2_BLAGS|nr:FAD binding domain-containing protein [Blastomyces gilchristii SLH14081]OAT13515.1 FAD binding domain-containing protein [Blastomyces gilchristii SLH14081]
MSLSVVWRHSAKPETYEEARTQRLFNRAIPKRYPVAIAFAKAESDIVDAVKLAIEKGCRVSVLSGGHSFPAWSVRDDAMLLDLGNYSNTSFDEETGVVSVSPSTTARALNEYLTARGRMFQVGHCPDVAGGALIRADARQNSDLFWAARGAGPGFPGVVTRFHLRTRPAIKEVPFTPEDGIEAIAIGSYPPGEEEPCLTIALVGFGEDKHTLEQALQKAEDSRPPGALTHSVGTETSLSELLESKADAYPHGHRYYVDNAYLKNDADVVAVLAQAFTTLPTKTSQVFWTGMKPCSRRQLPDMALSLQSDHFFALYGIWSHESEDSTCKAWAGAVMKGIEPHSVGAYGGEFDFQERRSEVWGIEQTKKLSEIQRRWDPDARICGCLGLDGAS